MTSHAGRGIIRDGGEEPMSQPHVMARCRAVTLIEAVLFISVALAVIVGGLVFYQQASTSSTMQRTVSLISALSAEASGILEHHSIPATNLEVSHFLAAAGAVPSGYLNATGDGVVSPWDGEMEIWVQFGANPGWEQFGPMTFLYHLFDVPPKICTRLAHFDAAGKGVLGFPITMIAVDHSNSGAPNGQPRQPPDHSAFYAANGALSRSDGAAACTAGSGPVWMFVSFAYQ
jgi:hypothetical protein